MGVATFLSKCLEMGCSFVIPSSLNSRRFCQRNLSDKVRQIPRGRLVPRSEGPFRVKGTLAAVLLLAFTGVPGTRLDGAGPAPPLELRFIEAGDGSFRFDTGILKGRARAGDDSKGLSEVTHLPTGQRIDGSVGLLTYYRVFTTGTRYGDGARKRASQARVLDDGALEVHWPAAADWPLELRAVYRWVTPAVVEVETAVRAGRELPNFEVFLSSYFDEAFPAAHVYVKRGGGLPPDFVSAEPEAGVWQMFPRDDAVVGMIRDGRWAVPPSPVEWAIRPHIAAPIVYRAHAEMALLAVLMSEPEGCYAVSAPHRGEKHFSAYFSLFGRDLKAGEIARTRSRLAIATEPETPRILRSWREFQGGR